MAQTAQFTMVERLDELSKAQTEATSWQRVVAGQALIGKSVSGTVDGTQVSGEVVSLRLTADGGVLELTGGRTLPVSAVETVTPVDRATSPVTTTAPGPAAPAPVAAAPAPVAAAPDPVTAAPDPVPAAPAPVTA